MKCEHAEYGSIRQVGPGHYHCAKCGGRINAVLIPTRHPKNFTLAATDGKPYEIWKRSGRAKVARVQHGGNDMLMIDEMPAP